MAKITSSRCKKLIAEITGTNEKDWKRIKKYKNVNVYRVFSNGIMNMEVIASPNDDAIHSVGPEIEENRAIIVPSEESDKRKYRYCVVKDEGPKGWPCGDYSISVADDMGNDNIRSGMKNIDKVMLPLGIKVEDCENTFSGKFNNNFKSFEDIKTHIASFGWKYDKKLEQN